MSCTRSAIVFTIGSLESSYGEVIPVSEVYDLLKRFHDLLDGPYLARPRLFLKGLVTQLLF